MAYDENSIRVMPRHEYEQRFGFAKVEELRKVYPWISEDAIRRLVTACQLSGWDIDKAEAKYLAKSGTAEPPVEFLEVYKALVADSR